MRKRYRKRKKSENLKIKNNTYKDISVQMVVDFSIGTRESEDSGITIF